MQLVTIIHYQSVTELGLVFHNSYSNFTNFPSIFSPLLNVSVSANKIEVCAKISIIDIRRFILNSFIWARGISYFHPDRPPVSFKVGIGKVVEKTDVET